MGLARDNQLLAINVGAQPSTLLFRSFLAAHEGVCPTAGRSQLVALLQLQMLRHVGDLPCRLMQHVRTVYEHVACPPVGYPELEGELWCCRYYLRNLCDERFCDWPIVDHIPFLQVRPH